MSRSNNRYLGEEPQVLARGAQGQENLTVLTDYRKDLGVYKTPQAHSLTALTWGEIQKYMKTN